MTVAKTFAASLAVIALMAAVSAWAWLRLPEAPIAIHFGLGGQPNGWAPKLQALAIGPAMALGLSLVFAFLALFTPEKAGPRRSMRAYTAIWIGLMLLLAATHGILVAHALSADLPVVNLIGVLVGALFMLIGNYAGKMRHNYVIGVRTPWTLVSEEVWDKTHRLYGPLMVLAGAGLFASAIVLRDPQQIMAALTSAALVPAVIATLYSIAISRPPRSRS